MTGINEVLRLLSEKDRAAIAVIERDRLPATDCLTIYGWWTLRHMLWTLSAVDSRGVGITQQLRTSLGHAVRKVWRRRFGGAAPFKVLAPKIRSRRNVITAAKHAEMFDVAIPSGGTNTQAIYPGEMWSECVAVVKDQLTPNRKDR